MLETLYMVEIMLYVLLALNIIRFFIDVLWLVRDLKHTTSSEKSDD